MLVKCWSNAGQMAVKCWSKAGQMLVEYVRRKAIWRGGECAQTPVKWSNG
jgi:hypothetical protein